MGKGKKSKLKGAIAKPSAKASKPKGLSRPSSTKPVKARPPPSPTIPFSPEDRILLVGEGDFSFARSLLAIHGCTSVLATTFDSSAIAREKYPQVASHIAALQAEKDCKVLYDVDATKLGKHSNGGGGKHVRDGGFDKISFNFPHVGGLTKDINRQVRHNQELLVGFFKAAMPLLVLSGKITVTIFEGEPYELWNIRDLARHVGLKVERSFKFQSSAYPGYRHARTLGNIEGGGGWKGEDRPARTYLFEASDGSQAQTSNKKRKRDDSDSEID